MWSAPGVYELELGSKLSELVLKLASARDVKMVQVGGACGRVLPADMLDTPLSYESILGAGAVTVFNETRDVIDVMYRNMEFLAEESCGRCTPCRDGCGGHARYPGKAGQGRRCERRYQRVGGSVGR